MDILALGESKIDSSFLTSQFLIESYKAPFRLDISDKSGGFSLQHTHRLDTGLSDFHYMICTELKCTYSRFPPRVITYRSFKNFTKSSFLKLRYVITRGGNLELSHIAVLRILRKVVF